MTTFDPRLPSKSEIIRRNLPILHADPQNKELFPKSTVISADKKRKNIAQIYKPTIPRRFVIHGPENSRGFFKCSATHCDTCRHGSFTDSVTSAWDNRRWQIKQHLTCTTPNVIYLIQCQIHPEAQYVGCTNNFKKRWANHKSDCKLKKKNKCTVVAHVCAKIHPEDQDLLYLRITALEHVTRDQDLASRELYWMCNLGTIFVGLNTRKDLNEHI